MGFDHPEDEPISIAAAALTEAEADAAGPNSRLIFDPEWRPTPRARNPTRPAARAPGVRSWASIVRDQQPLQHDQPLPTPSAYAPASESPSSTATGPASLLSPGHTLPPQPQIQEGAVAELLEKNQDVFKKVIDHRFPCALGDGTASLDGFRNYMIQDWLYLKMCTQLKYFALATTSDEKEVEGFNVRYKVEYTDKLAETCATMLGIPPSDMEAPEQSKELNSASYYYRTALQNNKAWLGYYIILLPCVLTYYEIAQRLMHDESTARNVVYHRAWTEVNYDDSSVKKYIKFINKNIARNGGVDSDWISMFRIACEREADIFNTGLHAPTPFQIIPDGIHSIYISSSKSVKLVLAVQNITDVRPPLDRYLPSNTRSSVVGMKPTGGDIEKWHVLATKDGYTFKNLGTGLYLGISPAPGHGEYRVLQAAPDPYCWWINPSSIQPDQGPSLYQIFDSRNLRYTLHAATEALNGIGSFTPIIAHKNSEAPCQMWSFDDYRFKPYERKQRTQGKDTEQPLKAQAMAAEIKKLMDKHSREMKEMAEVIAAKDRALRVEVAERSKMQEQHKEELGKMERVKMAIIRTAQEHKADNQSLRNEWWALRREANVSDRKYRDLLRPIRAQVCHWESFQASATFRSAAFHPTPIEFGRHNNVPEFIIRFNVDGDKTRSCIYSVQEGGSWATRGDGKEFRDFQVLVGNLSRLLWAPCRGRFEVKSIRHSPVPGLDEDVDGVRGTRFIARYSHSGTVYVAEVEDGADGIPWGSSRIQDYEVLCYRDL
ncbi:hypothetical protein B0H16DRAFT_1887778 [Mycena metata]|uniref:Thiaminase-2/PQQC domain-containing protein n=1 Tax=Mycena metata TaxID=1033252 RepID=A0AAD7IUA8_9AGAR|nr:hypothetical protein B0H16DRAFT_1887778 [Mycena metata]